MHRSRRASPLTAAGIPPDNSAAQPKALFRLGVAMSARSLAHVPVDDLLAAATAGDQGAWAELVVRYSGLVAAVVAGFRLQESDAADVVQNTWLRLVTHSATIRDAARL